jgi:hypothetical protein
MNYPHHHSLSHDVLARAVRPVCVYCLHLLDAAPAGTTLSAANRRALEDDHECIEKVNARRPAVSLPYN